MNFAETSDLLAFIARCDNRRADDATAIAWHSILSDLPVHDCLEASRRHFANSEAYLMPVHVRRGALELDRERRRSERERLEQSRALALDADPTRRDRSDAIRELIAELRDRLPDGDADKPRRAEWVEHHRRRARDETAEPNPLYDPQIAFQATPRPEETP